MKGIIRFVCIMMLFSGFVTVANAAITPATYTFIGGFGILGDSLPLPMAGSTLTLVQPGEFSLSGMFQSSTGIFPNIEVMYEVPINNLSLTAPVFGEYATNSSPFIITANMTTPFFGYLEMQVEGAGTLTTGQDFIFSSHYQGAATPCGNTLFLCGAALTTDITVVPVPGALLLGGLGTTLVSFLRRRSLRV